MRGQIPIEVSIAISALSGRALGDTIEARFASLIRPDVIREACWMTTNEDHQFRAAVGALMLSFGEGTAEWRRIEAEMLAIQKFSAFIQAASAGLTVSAGDIESPEEPIGLLKMWREREAVKR